MERREHAFPNGTVQVKLHKRKRLTLIVDRDELDAAVVERIEALEAENRVLRRKMFERGAPEDAALDAPVSEQWRRYVLGEGENTRLKESGLA